MRNARALAMSTVSRCAHEGAFSNIELSNSLDASQLSEADRNLYASLVYTTLENLLTIDYFIDKVSNRKMADTDEQIKNILRIGTCQIMFMDKIPESAACDESVKLAYKSAKPYVNGVLRNMCRMKDELKKGLEKASLSVRYSVSEDICRLIKEQYPKDYLKILEGFSYRLPLFLRVNTLKTTVETVLAETEGRLHHELKDCVAVTKNVAQTAKASGDGYFIQGVPSQFAIKLLDVKKGETVVDMCSCPGGKSFSAAIEMENQGKIISADIHKNKLKLVETMANKLGITIIETLCADGRVEREELIGGADKVICDVPCSSLGVINSKQEIRYKNKESFERLPEIQYEILKNGGKYLKKGGSLIYSTCTFNKKENGEVVDRFLRENGDFKLTFERQFMTYTDKTEGFYVAKLVKK